MKSILLTFVLIVRSTVAQPPNAAPDDWAARAAQLRTEGKYLDAVEALQKALAADQSRGVEDGHTIDLYDALASAYAESGQFAKATHEYQRALVLSEKIASEDTLLHGLLLAKMTAIPNAIGNDAKTIAQLQQAIAANAQTASADQLAVLRVSLARILSNRRDFPHAEQLLLDAVADLRRLRDQAPKRLADSLNALGVLRADQRRFPEAIVCYGESLQVAARAFGSENAELLPLLNNLGTAYLKTNNPQQAIVIFERAVALARKTLAEDHPSNVFLLLNYAIVLRKVGRKKEAKTLEARAKDIQSAVRRRDGTDSTIAVTSLVPAKTRR